MVIYSDCFDSHLICLHGISLELKRTVLAKKNPNNLKEQTWDLTKAVLPTYNLLQKSMK